jgi:hypothetical protein
LTIVRINTGRGAEEVTRNAVHASRFKRVYIDQGVVAKDNGMVGRDETHPSHVRGQRIDMVDSSRGQETFVQAAEVSQLELVGVRLSVFRNVKVHTSDPVSVLFQRGHEMVADESAGARHQDA